MDNYNEKLEKNLIDIVKQKENADKRLLFTETVIGIITVVTFLSLVFIASFAKMEDYVRFIIIILSGIAFTSICMVLVRIEQVAGYYECAKCHHKYVPTYLSVNMAMHMGRSRYMKCPECNKRSWQKKVITK